MAVTRPPARHEPWPVTPISPDAFRDPPREFGILPFWFLNGELDPDEMRVQLREFRDKGMPGIILHGRFGLETPYIGDLYLERIRLAAEEAAKLGLETWIYDEMNWPSGTADGRVLAARPDLAQRYIECISMEVRGPWFTYLTGGDSRYMDFERSTPVAAFAFGDDGQVVDLTPNLSFTNVIPWEVPPGTWTIMYVVEKRAEYYIDALDPEATREFLRIGYEPYARALAGLPPGQVPGFYTDEPAMHYYVTARDNPILPWTKDMFRRFHERYGYDLRRRLPDLFFELSADSARVRHDFFSALSEFYADAYYRQIHEWCQENGYLFTGHLLYEEWLRRMIRVEGNLFKHYPHLDVTGVDHLYPIIGTPDLPAEHVAIKVASSAAHQNGSRRLLCESFGGIFMDATMQRMKWITDWEYVLGVNLLNPHGFHYTVEGPRKRDWPPSMFYQYPWWRHYGAFSEYISRLSSMLTDGRHVAKLAVVWPINAMFATYTPQRATAQGDRTEHDFNALTDHLLRVHHDFDYVDEDALAEADLDGGRLRLRDEEHELVVLPPMAHIKLATLEALERFVAGGGALLGMVTAPRLAFADGELIDVGERVEQLFGATGITEPAAEGLELAQATHAGGGRTAFIRAAALARGLDVHVIPEGDGARYEATGPDGAPRDVTARVLEERRRVAVALGEAINALIRPDVVIANPDVQCLHRVKDGRDMWFLINSTQREQRAEVGLDGEHRPSLWDPSDGSRRAIAPWRHRDARTWFDVVLPPVGSAFVLAEPAGGPVVEAADFEVEAVEGGRVRGVTAGGAAALTVTRDGAAQELHDDGAAAPPALTLDGEWAFEARGPNALVIDRWLASPGPLPAEARPQDAGADTEGWLEMTPGAWSYQLPAEPAAPYPIDVWYRIAFDVDIVPESLDLLVDGFAGVDWAVHLNGEPVEAAAVRSHVDSQMRALPIAAQVRPGRNTIALRLSVADATDGLLDRIKLVGRFGLGGSDGRHLVAPPARLQPASWAEQGLPFFSGEGVYRTTITVPDGWAGGRVRLEADAGDDVLEAVVNGRPAGVRLWGPYRFEVGALLQPGENTIELRVSNTAANLIGGAPRPSGLRAAPRLAALREVTFEVDG